MVLYSDDIEPDAARLAEVGAMIVQPLAGESPTRSFHICDPWGNRIVVAERPGELG